MNVTPYQQDFILHFGEMGSRWGISRTVGQIYALLYITEAPINADDIVSALGLSRSNVSMGLKELQSWRLVKPQHLPGDRREYFQAPADIWQIFRTLVEERRKREVDPTLSMLRNALMNDRTGTPDEYAEQRLKEMQDLIELSTQWLDDMQQLEQRTAVKLMKLGGGVSKLLAGKAGRRS
ncbi:MAG: GbsR/MarR family transcriptional regulator [Pseudomonadota bacterium]